MSSIVWSMTQMLIPRATGPDEDDPVFANAANVLSDTEAREDMQTFVFSATLSKDLQNNLKRKQRVGKKGSKKATALGTSVYTSRRR